MNSQNKVIEIGEQKGGQKKDSKRRIKMKGGREGERGGGRVGEVYGSRKDEAIKERDEMVLFPVPFWEFVCLCEAMPDR